LRLGSLRNTKDIERSTKKCRCIYNMLALSQRLLLALIIEEYLKEDSIILYDGK
jgi:hypothetical protein